MGIEFGGQHSMKINPSTIQLSECVGLDLETNGLDPTVNDILMISISTDTDTYVLGVNSYSDSFIRQLLIQLKDCEKVIAHNAKFDCGFIYAKYGITYNNIFCTMLASQILDNRPDDPSHSLISCIDRYLRVTLSDSSYKRVMQRSFINSKKDNSWTNAQYEYAASDTKFLIGLSEIQLKRAEERGLTQVIRLENKLLPVIVKMEVEGCLIDVEGWKNQIDNYWGEAKDNLEHTLDEELRKLSKEFPQLSGKYVRKRRKQELLVYDIFGNTTTIENKNEGNINYGSQMQVLELFNLLNLEAPTNKHGKPSADETSFTTYMNENPLSPLNSFINYLLEYREYNKLMSTYGYSFLDQLDDKNYIHTSYTQCRTATGRLSSYGPNLQNIPSRGVGKILRDFFIAKKGHKLITCDMNSAEVAIAADYSKEPLLLKALLEGEDMHSKLASVSYSIIFEEDVTITNSHDPITIKGFEFIPNTLRTAHKNVLFAKFYKAGANRVYQVLAKYINLIHNNKEDRLGIAKEVSEALDKQMPILTQYLSNIIKEANTKGFLRGSKLGRVRIFNGDVYGEAANFPIQNTNAEAMKIALININKYLTTNQLGRIVMNIHDEVVVECREDVVQEVMKEVEHLMSKSISYFLDTVTGGAEAKFNDHWEK